VGSPKKRDERLMYESAYYSAATIILIYILIFAVPRLWRRLKRRRMTYHNFLYEQMKRKEKKEK